MLYPLSYGGWIEKVLLSLRDPPHPLRDDREQTAAHCLVDMSGRVRPPTGPDPTSAPSVSGVQRPHCGHDVESGLSQLYVMSVTTALTGCASLMTTSGSSKLSFP
jgi:hypothetical protein